jgi:hypothetical protein
MKNYGFVYVATGSGYLEEARRSAQSLREHNPGFPICLITDHEITVELPFDQVVIRHDVQHKPIDKLLALHCAFERAVFLDTDTRVCGDLSSLFTVLDQFDLAVLQDVNRGWNYALPGVPACFTEFNTGVIAFRRTPAVLDFFRQWGENHALLARTGGHVNDQPAFRQTLYFSSLRVAPLPSEFHFLANFPNSLLWKVRLIHARGDLDRMARQIDEQLGNRVYIPNVGVVPGFSGRRGWLRTTLKTTWRMLRLFFRPAPDSADANPRQWWLDEGKPPPPP